MNKFTLNNFTGGVYEGLGVNDFQNNEWAMLKGFVPYNESSIESQWPFHQIGPMYTKLVDAHGHVNSYPDDRGGSYPNLSFSFKSVFPLETNGATYLVAIRSDGTIWWCKAPESNVNGYNAITNTTWTNINMSENYGYDSRDSVYPSKLKIPQNPEYRFVCAVPFNPYVYNKIPDTTNPSDTSKDKTPINKGTDYLESVCAGVLIASRRKAMHDKNGNFVFSNTQLVYYTPPYADEVNDDGYDSNYKSIVAYVDESTQTVKLSTFPNIRRWPRVSNPGGDNTWLSNDYVLNWSLDTSGNLQDFRMPGSYPWSPPSTIISENIYGYAVNVNTLATPPIIEIHLEVGNTTQFVVGQDINFGTAISPFFLGNYRIQRIDTGTYTAGRKVLTIVIRTQVINGVTVATVPYTNLTGKSVTNNVLYSGGQPSPINWHHPYSYVNSNQAATPGLGIIPRGNIGTMWNNNLIIGDIEYNTDAGTDKKNLFINLDKDAAFLGSTSTQQLLSNYNTSAHRGWVYFSNPANGYDIDQFAPDTRFRMSGTNNRIAGLHNINNLLVAITTAGGPNDGVISFAGNLASTVPYNKTPVNINAVRKQLVRGGIGPAEKNEDDGRTFLIGTQTSFWPEAGVATFVDKKGGIYYTDGISADRLDYRGFLVPNASTAYDHTAAVGRHLFVWRDSRLLCFTLTNSQGTLGQGCWTELVLPHPAWDQNVLTSMVGSTKDLYMCYFGNVYRFTLNGNELMDDRAFSPITNIDGWTEKGTFSLEQFNPYTGQYEIITSWNVLEVATATKGSNILGYGNTLINTDDQTKINWHRAGVSFHTKSACGLYYGIVKSGPWLDPVITYYNGKPNYSTYKQWTVTTPTLAGKTYFEGTHTYEMPAGIGASYEVSSYWRFIGDVKLEGVILWSTGATMKRGAANE